jgi:hypothetical protein
VLCSVIPLHIEKDDCSDLSDVQIWNAQTGATYTSAEPGKNVNVICRWPALLFTSTNPPT